MPDGDLLIVLRGLGAIRNLWAIVAGATRATDDCSPHLGRGFGAMTIEDLTAEDSTFEKNGVIFTNSPNEGSGTGNFDPFLATSDEAKAR